LAARPLITSCKEDAELTSKLWYCSYCLDVVFTMIESMFHR